MKISILSAVILLLILTDTFAQNSVFRKYRSECMQSFGIELKKPKGFKVINEMTFLQVSDKNGIGAAYSMALESKAKDCLILYPYFTIGMDLSTKNMAYGEVESALGFTEKKLRSRSKIVDGKILFMIQGTADSNCDKEQVKLDSAKYVKMITGNDMEEFFYADTVYIYKIPLPENYRLVDLPNTHKANYNRCIGINVIKTGRPSAIMKILLTEQGKQKEDEYLQLLLRSICY